MRKKFLLTSITDYLKENIDESVVLYHGTNNIFSVFNDEKPIFFVDSFNVAKSYGEIIIKAKLEMNNPIELDFDGNSTYYFFDKWYLPSDLANKIKEIASDIKNHYILDDDLKEYLEYLGFNDLYGDLDGIIMKNIRDDVSGVFSNNNPANNYVVFDKKQINIVK